MERNSPSWRRLLTLFSLFYLLSHHHQVGPTQVPRRRALFALPCNIHWITGPLAKSHSPRLQRRIWTVLIHAALARLTLKSWSGSTPSIMLSPPDATHPRCRILVSLSLYLYPTQFGVARHHLRRRSRGRLARPWWRAQRPASIQQV